MSSAVRSARVVTEADTETVLAQIVRAYETGSLRNELGDQDFLALPQQSRTRLRELSHDLLDAAKIIEHDSTFTNDEAAWSVLQTFCSRVESRGQVYEIASEILLAEEVPLIADLVLSGRLKPSELLQLRESSHAKAFRRWLWAQDLTDDKSHVVESYKDLIRNAGATKLDFRPMRVLRLVLNLVGSAASGTVGEATLGPIGGWITGALPTLIDQTLVEKIVTNRNPRRLATDSLRSLKIRRTIDTRNVLPQIEIVQCKPPLAALKERRRVRKAQPLFDQSLSQARLAELRRRAFERSSAVVTYERKLDRVEPLSVGTGFFLEARGRIFGVTNAHVLKRFIDAREVGDESIFVSFSIGAGESGFERFAGYAAMPEASRKIGGVENGYGFRDIAIVEVRKDDIEELFKRKRTYVEGDCHGNISPGTRFVFSGFPRANLEADGNLEAIHVESLTCQTIAVDAHHELLTLRGFQNGQGASELDLRGTSGSAVLNEDGRLCGIFFAGDDARNEIYAIPIIHVVTLIEEYLRSSSG